MGRKISVIGAGKVGSTTAHLIALKGLADVVIVNRTEGIAKGVALDIAESMPVECMSVRVTGTGDYGAISGSDIIVVTAGAQRREGMSRDDLLKVNADIVSEIANEIKKNAPDSIVLVVSNPLDAMVYLAKKVTGFDKRRVMGMAGALDSSRFRSFISDELKVGVKEVNAMVLGSHGDSMVPLLSATSVGGKPVSELITAQRLSEIVTRTRDAGAEIIKLEGSSAYYAPASAVVSMVDSILNDKNEVIPCSVFAEGEYGLNGLFIGLPARLGKGGVKEIVELELTENEKKELSGSAEKISASVAALK
ncbi:malate dehydrogenase [Candidatus Marsarchaeota archaeon]|nr:malate dehydrogenase [Candidatus Marsarchaeota archaeon]